MPLNSPENAPNVHCAEHPRFRSECAVCRQAQANHQPYPLKHATQGSRSFGVTGEVTAAGLREEGSAGWTYAGSGVAVGGASRTMVRLLRRLIWPF